MAMDELQQLADELMKEEEINVRTQSPRKVPSGPIIRALMDRLRPLLKEIKEKNPAIYKRLEEPKERLKTLYKNADKLDSEEWENIKGIKELITETHELLSSTCSQDFNEKIIEERLLALKKRGKFYFRVRDSWDTV